MTIPSAAQSRSILPPNQAVPLTEKDGRLTSAGMAIFKQVQTLINGLTPTIACNAAFAANLYTLTPVSISPMPGNFVDEINYYLDYVAFAFVAPNTSTGAATATVVPKVGSLATLNVYKSNGAAATIAGDIVANSFYILYYVDSLNAGAGGFVLK